VRYFTVEEASTTLPEVERLVRRLRTLRDDARAGEAAEVSGRLAEIGCVLRLLVLASGRRGHPLLARHHGRVRRPQALEPAARRPLPLS